MPSYAFNPHKQVRIWLSKDRNVFLNLENKVRLIKLRRTNPQDEINLFYDSELLSIDAQMQLEDFCLKFKITPKDVRKDVFPYCKTFQEIELIRLYEDEVRHLKEGGNLGAASDKLRWMSPVYISGTYGDFDLDKVDTRALPEFTQVNSPLLFNAGSIKTKAFGNTGPAYIAPAFNNDIIAVVDPEKALPLIQQIQDRIILACNHERGSSIFNTLEQFYKNNLCGVMKAKDAALHLSLNSHMQEKIKNWKLLGHMMERKGRPPLTSRELRQKIVEVTQDNASYCNLLKTNEKEHAAQIRQNLMKPIGPLSSLFLSKKQYQELGESLSKSDAELVNLDRKRMRIELLKESVVYTTGPGAISAALLRWVYEPHSESYRNYATCALASYGLDEAFTSKQRVPLNAVQCADLTSSERNDLSWLEVGQIAQAQREHTFWKEMVQLPVDLLHMKSQIEAHKEKIEQDLTSRFAFYRDQSRRKKIKVLNDILSFFSIDQFDITRFKQQLDDYLLDGELFASLGASKTKELIKELEYLVHQAEDMALIEKVKDEGEEEYISLNARMDL